jgi:16S rRNA (adenine1518-N6/adenine1519-N6)-dimethyltransferase
MVAAARLTAADTVLEIGPGLGVLTRQLAARAGRVIAVELDDRLIAPLREQFAGQPQVAVVHGDILALDPMRLIQGDKGTRREGDKERGGQGDNRQSSIVNHQSYKVVANLPYYITSAVLRHLLEAQPHPACMVVMVQEEVAERVCAKPGDLSLLAVSVQFYAQAQIVVRVPASAFRPRPKVDSAVLRLDCYPELLIPGVEPALFFKLVRAGFSQKRKQLGNTLSAALAIPKEEATALLHQANIDATRRAETITLTEWGQLYAAFMASPLQPAKDL